MKAAQISEYGDASVLNVVETKKPEAKDGQALVEVYASSLNPFDSSVRAGYMKQMIPLELPVTIGGDIAGIITELGAATEGLSIGDKVYGQANVVAGNSGAFAEYAATTVNSIAKAPSNLNFEEAASLPLVGVSAWQALTQHINLQPGQKIFINGGAGGIGQVAIQIAKHIGVYIATTALSEESDTLTALGANEIIDYKTQDFTEILSDYDAVFDTVGGDLFTKSLVILKEGGIAVSMTSHADESKVEELGITAITQSTHVTTEALDQLRELIEAGIVKPNVGKIFTLDQIQDAFVARESGTVKGKVVLRIKD